MTRTILVAAMLVTLGSAGCISSDGDLNPFNDLSEVFTGGGGDGIEGHRCSEAFVNRWSQQAIVMMQFHEDVDEDISFNEMQVTASKFNDGEKKSDTSYKPGWRTADDKGCASVRLDGDGTYVFNAFAQVQGKQRCYVMGENGGQYDGVAPAVEVPVLIEEVGC